MSKFPSITNTIIAIQKTSTRFPIETLISIFGFLSSVFYIGEFKKHYNENLLLKCLLASSLCLVGVLSVSLFFIANKKKPLLRYLSSTLVILVLFVYVFNFSEKIKETELQNYFVLNLALHLLVSFAAFLSKKYDKNEFWEFNKQLFLRILTCFFYSGVLYSGLCLAILASKELFQLQFGQNIYGYLFAFIACIFNTLFFLKAVPEVSNQKISLSLEFPNALKKFTQYILLPLISIYLVILLCYETKIIATQTLPNGWVSVLILVFAIVGILSFLLVYPIATNTTNKWMHTYNRWFYYLLLPLLVLLFWAIFYRISIYGVTHERYYVVALAIWLTFLVGYFLIKKEAQIKWIPISLCITCLVAITEPFSADTISKKSQLTQLEKLLLFQQKNKFNFEEEKKFSGVIDFLNTNYGVSVFLPLCKGKLDVLLQKNKNPYTTEIVKALGVTYRNSYDNETSPTTFYYNYYEDSRNNVENISGYDVIFNIDSYYDFACKNCATIGKINYSVRSVKRPYGLDIIVNNEIIPLRILSFINNNNTFELENNGGKNKKITEIIETPKYKLQLLYLNVNGTKKGDKKIADNYAIKILMKIK